MKCQFCSAENPADSKFCGICGGDLKTVSMPETDGKSQEQFNICPFCSENNPADARFCARCGNVLGYTNLYGSSNTENNTQYPPRYAGSEPDSRKKPKKKRKILAVLIPAVVVVIAAVLAALYFCVFRGGKINISGNTVSYDNGDVVYVPADEDLAYDEDAGVIYYNNVITVYLNGELDESELDKLAASVDGRLAGNIAGDINVAQIVIEETDLDGINAKAETLMESGYVLYSGYDFPIYITFDTADANPWSGSGYESDRGNEADPGGSDWWAEAIGAYTAWELTGEITLSSVTVGILDSGFDLDHEDLSDDISMISGYETNSENNHGTHVAGLIGADNNTVGIRGVADSADLICADLTPITDDKDSENYVNCISSGEYIAILKTALESGAKVINNSYGQTVYSLEGFIKATYSWDDIRLNLLEGTDTDEDYANYLKWAQESSDELGRICLVLINQVMASGNEDFIIVQSAGNGYDGEGPGADASYNGYFCAIDEELFNSLALSTQYTYSDIKDHILIVGAVSNEQTSDGSYVMTDYSSYGSAVDICAPGEDIYSTVLNSSYGAMSGTSMSAPIVSGAAALLWQIDDSLTAGEVKALLIDFSASAVGTGDDSGTYYPMLDIGEAAYRAIYAGYTGTVLYTDGKAAEGITILAIGENDITLETDVTSETGTYSFTCSRFEIKNIVIIVDDEEVLRIEVPDEYLSYDAAAALDVSDEDYEPHDMGKSEIESPYVEILDYVKNFTELIELLDMDIESDEYYDSYRWTSYVADNFHLTIIEDDYFSASTKDNYSVTLCGFTIGDKVSDLRAALTADGWTFDPYMSGDESIGDYFYSYQKKIGGKRCAIEITGTSSGKISKWYPCNYYVEENEKFPWVE